MGLCSSVPAQAIPPEEKMKSKEIEHVLIQDHKAERLVHKLLLLGAGQSGKSTLFKQMITIYGKGFSEGERMRFIPIIYSNTVTSIKILCSQSKNYGGVTGVNAASLDFVEAMKEDDPIDSEAAAHIKAVWLDRGIQTTYAARSGFQLMDSAQYYLERVEAIGAEGYIPTEQDVLRSRVPTTGIVENSFDIDSHSFRIFDVGGQRSERKKWIHCFEHVTAVLFVAAISEYDQVLYEDESTNRVTEALMLFDEVCNSEWFGGTSVILFLNKRDLFAAKLAASPSSLRAHFPEYTGTGLTEALAFMQQLFESRNRQGVDVYSHVTCATDTNNVYAVFNAVKDIIIKKGLTKAGLMG